jgi:hypothetical protein
MRIEKKSQVWLIEFQMIIDIIMMLADAWYYYPLTG